MSGVGSMEAERIEGIVGGEKGGRAIFSSVEELVFANGPFLYLFCRVKRAGERVGETGEI